MDSNFMTEFPSTQSSPLHLGNETERREKSRSSQNNYLNINCSVCLKRRNSLMCVPCGNRTLQQRRTTLAALKADVAVLKRKSEHVLETNRESSTRKNELLQCLRDVEKCKELSIKTREKLCSDRILVADCRYQLRERESRLHESQKFLDVLQSELDSVAYPVVYGLESHISRMEDSLVTLRQQRVKEIFRLFQIEVPSETKKSETQSSNCGISTICDIPLPNTGDFSGVPPEIVSAALGHIIHLLQMLYRYLQVEYPHPMTFNGSFSTIGSSGEGAGCHTLYPDGSLGFERALLMLQRNVIHLCLSQGVNQADLHRTHMLPNLVKLSCSSTMGRRLARYPVIQEMEVDQHLPPPLAETTPQILPQYTKEVFTSGDTTDEDWAVIDSEGLAQWNRNSQGNGIRHWGRKLRNTLK